MLKKEQYIIQLKNTQIHNIGAILLRIVTTQGDLFIRWTQMRARVVQWITLARGKPVTQ